MAKRNKKMRRKKRTYKQTKAIKQHRKKFKKAFSYFLRDLAIAIISNWIVLIITQYLEYIVEYISQYI